MWPDKAQRQFDIALKTENSVPENVWNAAYNKLLTTLFPVDTDFAVVPGNQKFHSVNDADDYFTIEIYLDQGLENRPLFVLILKDSRDIQSRSRRRAADEQLRQRLGDLFERCPLPVLHGISAFGSRVCFYTVTRESREITPLRMLAKDMYAVDTVPIERWDYDILTEKGEAAFRQVVQGIKDACAQLNLGAVGGGS